jgi:hypothetical protein
LGRRAGVRRFGWRGAEVKTGSLGRLRGCRAVEVERLGGGGVGVEVEWIRHVESWPPGGLFR